MSSTGDAFPGTAEVLLHLGKDTFAIRIYDRGVTGDSAFVAVELGGGIKILTPYTDDLRRLSVQLADAAEQLDQAHAHGGLASDSVKAATPDHDPVLVGQSVLW